MPEPVTPAWLLAALAIACWLSATIGLSIAVRMWRGLSVLRYQPRRQVPWQGIDLLVILWCSARGAGRLSGNRLVDHGPGDYAPARPSSRWARPMPAHCVAKMLDGAPAWMFVLGGLSVVVVAPIVEEFLFRVLLQGWLEARRAAWKRQAAHVAAARTRRRRADRRRLVPVRQDPLPRRRARRGIRTFTWA